MLTGTLPCPQYHRRWQESQHFPTLEDEEDVGGRREGEKKEEVEEEDEEEKKEERIPFDWWAFKRNFSAV